jgi:hypothetical protein
MAATHMQPSEFHRGVPPPNQHLKVLCEDASGTYVLPFVCVWRDGKWHNLKSVKGEKPLDAEVVGWHRQNRAEVSFRRATQSDGPVGRAFNDRPSP